MNSSNSYDRVWQLEEQNYEVKIKKRQFSVNSSPEATVHLVLKVLLTCKIKQKITPLALDNFVATR